MLSDETWCTKLDIQAPSTASAKLAWASSLQTTTVRAGIYMGE